MTTFYYWRRTPTASKHQNVAESIDRAWDIAFDRYVTRPTRA